MSFKTKRVKIRDAEVEVRCEPIAKDESSCHRVRFIAAIGEARYSHTLTIGPEDGELPELTTEQVQKDVDAARAYAGAHAHFHHSVSKIIPEVD